MTETPAAESSRFLEQVTETVGQHYGQVELLNEGAVTITARAVRYGKRYFLKGLAEGVRHQSMYQQMLAKEFGILMSLHHQGVVQAIEMASVEPIGECIVMEWVEGSTLHNWLSDHSERAEARRLTLMLLDAVEHIHRHGIAHRDLKPTNIMVTDNGSELKIVDFGLADSDAHVNLKQPAGTEGYMSPEQCAGREADIRNDIYSLGAVLLSMNIGRAWRKLAQRCLKPIESRWQSVAELREALLLADRRRKWAARIATTAVTAIAAAAIIASSLAALRQHSDNSQLQASNDSLRQVVSALEAQQSLQQRSIAGLSDSLNSTIAANEALMSAEQSREAHSKAIEQAVERGKQVIDRAWRQSAVMEHLDTLSDMKYLWDDFNSKYLAGNKAINRYIKELDASFSAVDKNDINRLLEDYNAKTWLNPLIEKMEKIRKHDR